MSASNAKIAALLRQYAAVLVLERANRFKVKAYRRAADTLETLDTDVAAKVAQGDDLMGLPGIGSAISRTIQEIVQTGRMPQLDRAVKQHSPELLELTSRPHLDPKKVLRIYKKLNIHSLAEMQQQLDRGEIRRVFGARMDFHIRRGLDDRPRLLLYHAEPIAEKIELYLRTIPGVERVSMAGSLRRKKDTVGDLNFVVATKKSAAVFKTFAQFGGIESSTRRSKQERLFRLSNGLGIGLFCTPPQSWGLALLLQTGSALHLEELQRHPSTKHLSIAVADAADRRRKFAEEEDVYREMGLSYIPPELREGRGEVRAAFRKQLPQLVQWSDIQGDLHMHTVASDGANTIAEMAEAAVAKGYSYIAITDHSQSLKLTNGLTEERLWEQIREIDRLNRRLDKLVVLKSAEVDILEDGSLDYSREILRELDFTICSIHSKFGLNKDQQTDRVRRAMDHPYFNILGHATGRLLLRREGYELDIDKVIEHARENHCFFEINSSPDRLDLSDEHAKLAKDAGIRIAINTDAHSTSELEFLSAGIHQARRAWLEPGDVLNCLSRPDLLQELHRQTASRKTATATRSTLARRRASTRGSA